MKHRIYWLAIPYGVGLAAFIIDVFAGGAGGREAMAVFWIIRGLTVLALASWIAVLVMTFRRTGWLGLLATPSALIVWAISQDIPLLLGACLLARACV